MLQAIYLAFEACLVVRPVSFALCCWVLASPLFSCCPHFRCIFKYAVMPLQAQDKTHCPASSTRVQYHNSAATGCPTRKHVHPSDHSISRMQVTFLLAWCDGDNSAVSAKHKTHVTPCKRYQVGWQFCLHLAHQGLVKLKFACTFVCNGMEQRRKHVNWLQLSLAC